MLPMSEYTTPPVIQEINDGVQIFGGTFGLIATVASLWVGFRTYMRHRRRRQEDMITRIMAEHTNQLQTQMKEQCVEISNLRQHFDEVTKPMVDRQLQIEASLMDHLQAHIV
jgi:hypothetical protein